MKSIIAYYKKHNKNILLILSLVLITLQIGSLESMESFPVQQINNKENNNSNDFIPNTLHRSTLEVWNYLINTVKSNEAIGKFISLLIDTNDNASIVYRENYLNYFKEYTVNEKKLMDDILSNKNVTSLIEKVYSNTTFLTENKSFAQFVNEIINNKNTDDYSILKKQEHVNNFIMLMENSDLLLHFLIRNCDKDAYYDFISLLQNDYVREILQMRNMRSIIQNVQNVFKVLPKFSGSIFLDNNVRNIVISELNNIYNENKKSLKYGDSILESIEEEDDEYENSTNSFIQMLKDHDSLVDYFKKNNNKKEYYNFIDILNNKEIKIALVNHNNKDEIISNIIDTLQLLDEDNLYKVMQEEIIRTLFE